MFTKWRIKEHMEVTDSQGVHIGTVDGVEGDFLKLTRSDSDDGRHREFDLSWVDKVEDNRVYLKADTPLPGRPMPIDAPSEEGQHASPAATKGAPMMGTSGSGTGFGGSGPV